MPSQEQLNKKQGDQKASKLGDMKQEMENTLNTQTTRIVTLRLDILGCGCGALFGADVQREVPFDSPLKDGDTIELKDLQKGDKAL